MNSIGKGTKLWHKELSTIERSVIGENCVIHSHVWIVHSVIGNNVRVQAFSFIPPGTTIEDDAFIGPRVTITNDKYPPSDSPASWAPVTIKKGARIGAGVTILPGVTIGEGSLIGAGSVVTKDIPAGVVACGSPAKVKAGCKST